MQQCVYVCVGVIESYTDPDASSNTRRVSLLQFPCLVLRHNLLFDEQILQPVVGRGRLLGLAAKHGRLVHLLSLKSGNLGHVLTILQRHSQVSHKYKHSAAHTVIKHKCHNNCNPGCLSSKQNKRQLCLISRFLSSTCTEVSDVENIGQGGRLSQLSWLLGAL